MQSKRDIIRNLFPRLWLRNAEICPALFLAPMAGVTHSAFRRLVADFGGYGALYTEMLSATALLHERLETSPFTKRRAHEGLVIYQLRCNGDEDLGAIVHRLVSHGVAAIDLNLGCPAPEIRKRGAGAALFADIPRLDRVLGSLRCHWDGPLTVKCRLGAGERDWEKAFEERLRLFASHGVDAIVLHPRFSGEKLKRTVRWQHFARAAARSDIPLIANGDIVSCDYVAKHAEKLQGAKALMLGRIVAAKPWVFCQMRGEGVDVDYGEVWERFYRYVIEDFGPEKSIGRLKEFTAYYSRNFFFGHELYRRVQGAASLGQLRDRAREFFARGPRTLEEPLVSGV